jgi:hypothetical protein
LINAHKRKEQAGSINDESSEDADNSKRKSKKQKVVKARYYTSKQGIIPSLMPMCCRSSKDIRELCSNAVHGDYWAYGEIDDKQDGLWAVMTVMDPEPHKTFQMRENGCDIGVSRSLYYAYIALYNWCTIVLLITLNIAHIVAGKDLWLTVIVTKVFQDACLAESMMFKVEPEDDDTDEHPEQCTERERYVHMCTLNMCSCGGICRYLSAMMKEPKSGYVLCTETITATNRKVVLPLSIWYYT